MSRITLSREDVLAHPEANCDNVFVLELMDGKKYKFSQDIVDKYPKLKDKAAPYTLSFEAILPLLLDYPASCIPKSLIDERHEKELFLSNCEFFGISLDESVILHLSGESEKKITECCEFVERQAGKKGKDKVRFSLRKDVRRFCSKVEGALKCLYSEIKPIEIIEKLELGEVKELVLWDWKSKNAVLPFIDSFMKEFFP